MFFLTGHPSSINIFKPKVNLFQQASILINGEEENVRDLEEKPKIISLKDKSLQTNFNITNSVPEKCIDPNTQIEYIIYMIKNIYEHSFIKYNYSLISCLNNVTTQLSIQISEDPSSLSDKDIDKYRRYTQFKTILVNNESEIQEIINEIDKILIGDKLERNAQDKIQTQLNKILEISKYIENITKEFMEHNNINPLHLETAQQFDPLILANRYATFMNVLKFKHIIQEKLKQPLDFSKIIKNIKDPQDIKKHTYKEITGLATAQNTIKSLEEIFTTQQNWLIQNALRFSKNQDLNAERKEDYLKQCCSNVHAITALKYFLLQFPKLKTTTLAEIMKAKQELEIDGLFDECDYFFEPDGVNIKTSLKDLEASELLQTLQKEQLRLTQASMFTETLSYITKTTQQATDPNELTEQLANDKSFVQWVQDKVDEQVTATRTSTVKENLINPEIFEMQEREIEKELKETLFSKNKVSQPKEVQTIKSKLYTVLLSKLRLNCANRLLVENKIQMDMNNTTLESESIKTLQKEDLHVTTEDVKMTFANKPDDLQPHTKIYIQPNTETEVSGPIEIKTTLVEIIDESDPQLAELINQQLLPSEETIQSDEKWYITQPKYELSVTLSDKFQIEKFFVIFRTDGLVKAVKECRINEQDVKILYHDQLNSSKDKEFTLSQYKLRQKDKLIKSNENEITLEAMQYYLMGNLDKQNLKTVKMKLGSDREK